MKKDQHQKLKEKSKEDLLTESQSLKDKFWQLRVDMASGKVKNVSEVRKIKKTVAVINTLLNKK